MSTITKLIIVALLIGAAACGANAGALWCSTDTPVNLQGWFLGGFEALSNGNFIVNDGASVREIDSTGALQRTLYTYTEEGGVYGSFVRCQAGKVYFGESSNGNIYSLSYDNPSDVSLFTHLTNNFDMAFRDGSAYVAATSADYANTSIYLADGSTNDVIVNKINGPAGPIAFDQSGNLYYGYYDLYGPDSALYTWSADGVTSAIGAAKLAGDSGTSIANVPGPYGMVIDKNGTIFYSTNGTAVPEICYRKADGTSGVFTAFDAAALWQQYAAEPGGDSLAAIESPFLTTLSYDPVTDSISAAVNYTVASYTDETKTTVDEVPYTVISTVVVPEPGSLMALCSLIGLAASTKLLRFRGK